MTILVLSSVATGVIATAAMLATVYLPLTWRGHPCDVVGMLGSALAGGREGARANYLGGVAFAFLYGLLVAALLRFGGETPSLALGLDLPTTIDLVYPLAGAALGFAHGVVITLLMTIVVTEHHPLHRFRGGMSFVVPLMLGHLAFGAVAGFFQHQFLQLLGG
jgi:hypothetical protein